MLQEKKEQNTPITVSFKRVNSCQFYSILMFLVHMGSMLSILFDSKPNVALVGKPLCLRGNDIPDVHGLYGDETCMYSPRRRFWAETAEHAQKNSERVT